MRPRPWSSGRVASCGNLRRTRAPMREPRSRNCAVFPFPLDAEHTWPTSLEGPDHLAPGPGEGDKQERVRARRLDQRGQPPRQGQGLECRVMVARAAGAAGAGLRTREARGAVLTASRLARALPGQGLAPGLALARAHLRRVEEARRAARV